MRRTCRRETRTGRRHRVGLRTEERPDFERVHRADPEPHDPIRPAPEKRQVTAVGRQAEICRPRQLDDRGNLEAHRAGRSRPLADALVRERRQRCQQHRSDAPGEPRPVYPLSADARGCRHARRVRQTVQGEREIAGRLKSRRRTLFQAAIRRCAREPAGSEPQPRGDARIFVEDRRHRLRAPCRDEMRGRPTAARTEWRRRRTDPRDDRRRARGPARAPCSRRCRAPHQAASARATWECARCRRRRLILRQLRQPEVENLDPAIPGNEDVLGLEITMDDALFVRRLEPARDLKGMLDRLANSDRATIQPVPKRLPFEQLGYDEGRFGMGADVVHGEDVRVVQRRRRAGFLLESMQAIDVGRERRGQVL